MADPLKVKIIYCGQWNYLPKASSLAADLKERFQAETELDRQGGGIFDVYVNGELIFSKHSEGNRFPEHQEIFDKLSQRAS